MADKLLSVTEVAKQLGISRRCLYAHLPKLRALGLRRIQIGRLVRFSESSLTDLIALASQKEITL